MRSAFFFAVVWLAGLLPATQGLAQWQVVTPAPTTADLRGIDNVGGGVVWASGSDGTVLRSEDAGYMWQKCAVPPGAEHLDFRGVQAFDANTAIVMSSGKGDLSRLYKTTDGCQSWKLIATNPDKDGFWDAVQKEGALGNEDDPDSDARAVVLGDSVGGRQRVWEWKEGWEDQELEPMYATTYNADTKEASFAASNSVLQVVRTRQIDKTWKYRLRWATGTAEHTYMWILRAEHTDTCEPCVLQTQRVEMPLASNNSSGGTFSFGFKTDFDGVAVGGDYGRPGSPSKTAAYSSDAGLTWKLSVTPPHGFRSAVAYDEAAKAWITVGPNGTDVSTDDGRNWRALRPDAKYGDQPDADRDWNALSLPFVVGPHGRIGILRPEALESATPGK